MTLVSVIIPTYAHAEVILETLGSVFKQTYNDYEVIVVNDGSPDETSEVLAPLVRQGKIRYYEKTNGGVAAAREFGVRQARGTYIAFLDDDDIWPADKLEWQVETLDSNPSLVAVGGSWRALGGDHEMGGFLPEWRNLEFETLFGGSPFISPGQVLVRLEALNSVGGFDANIWGTDDHDLWMRLCRHGRVLVKNRVALFYRFHTANASKNLPKMLANFRHVIRKNMVHVPLRRRRLHYSRSWIWVYVWTGAKHLEVLFQGLRERNAKTVLRESRYLFPFWVPFVLVPGLRRKVLRDLRALTQA